MALPPALSSLAPVGLRGTFLDRLPASASRTQVADIESLGFSSLWIGESTGHEVFSQATLLLSATDRLVVASGIANVYARDPAAMMAAGNTLADAFPNRFVLGLGLSHAPMIEQRGHDPSRPLTYLRNYLDAMDAAPYRAPLPVVPAPRVLGALGPRSLALAAERGMGAHPYFVPVEHTRRAREILGSKPFLAPEMAVVDARDRGTARRLSRTYATRHLSLENYRANLRRLGFGDNDLDHETGDRVVDQIITWGGRDAIEERIAAHLDAGADHVVVHPVATVDAPIENLESLVRDVAADIFS